MTNALMTQKEIEYFRISSIILRLKITSKKIKKNNFKNRVCNDFFFKKQYLSTEILKVQLGTQPLWGSMKCFS